MSLWGDIKSVTHAVAKIVDMAVPDPGDFIQQGARALGVPEPLAEIAAAAVNAAAGNYGAAALDTLEAFTADDGVGASQSAKVESLSRRPVDPGPPPPVATASLVTEPMPLDDGPVRARKPVPTSEDAPPAIAAADSKAPPPIDFTTKTDKEILDMVNNHKIPDSVSKDPMQMLAIQQAVQRMNEFFTLLSTLMRTLHEMRSTIIGNMRG